MRAQDIHNNTDPNEIRNILKRLKLAQDAGLRAVPNIIINQAPQQFPPLPSPSNGLNWFNVKNYGALGDGAADDTAAINNAIAALNAAGRGVLYFPAGAYLCSAALTTITAAGYVLGDGTGNYTDASYGSKIIMTSATAVLFTISALYGCFRDLDLINTAASPSAGSGIHVSGASIDQRVDFFRVRVVGFYIGIDIDAADQWLMDSCMIVNPVQYGLRVQTPSPAHAAWKCANTIFWGHPRYANAAIQLTNSSGGHAQITDCYIAFFVNGVVATGSSPFGQFLFFGNMIASLSTGHGISIMNAFSLINITGNTFYLNLSTSNNSGNAININICDWGVVIAGNGFSGGSTPAAIVLTTVTPTARIVGNVRLGFSALLTQTGCTGVIIIEPGTSVAAETNYGQSSALGTSGYYAREDHTHGTPALSTDNPQAVGANAAPGSGNTPSKNDHVHAGVHSLAKSGAAALKGDVTLSAGANIELNQAGNNIEIEGVAAGQYRLYLHVDNGTGGFNWVTSDGRPVTALYDLE